MTDCLVVSCEHGGNRVPARYRHLFRGLKRDLQTHLGYDFGALRMARDLAAAFRAPLAASTVTRLVVDLNRSIGHPRLYGRTVRGLGQQERERILAEHYLPYRTAVERLIAAKIAGGRPVVHVSAHSFTPELSGRVRTADVGLLYDPARAGEVCVAAAWKVAVERASPGLRVRRNYPYSGVDDGFVPYLRTRFRPYAYLGVELEMNQAIVVGARGRWAALRTALVDSLRVALASQ